jgi:hypothetical protein
MDSSRDPMQLSGLGSHGLSRLPCVLLPGVLEVFDYAEAVSDTSMSVSAGVVFAFRHRLDPPEDINFAALYSAHQFPCQRLR